MKNTSEMSDMNFNCSPVVAVGCGCKKINIILLSLGTVKEYTVTWIIFILPSSRVTELVM